MLWRWLRKRKAAGSHGGEPVVGYFIPQSAAELLSTPRRQALLGQVWQLVSLSREQFDVLYLKPIERCAELAQQFPASPYDHHVYPGGLLDHCLSTLVYALKLRQSRLLPVGASAQVQGSQAEAWGVATAYAALLRDLGKLTVEASVQLANGAAWHPWMGPPDRPYRFRYVNECPVRLHAAAAGMLLTQLVPHSTLQWLSGHPELWSALIQVLAGHDEEAGALGELVSQAYLASVASGREAAAARPLEQSAIEVAPVMAVAPAATSDDADDKTQGEAFIHWLREGILTSRIVTNTRAAKVHSVAGTAFVVSPGIFHRYVQEHPETAEIAQLQGADDWRWVQRCFEKQRVHRKGSTGLNIWVCELQDLRKTRDIKGYLFKDPLLIFAETPADNPALRLKT
ncbi:TraI domain-containing protein [Pseudomonas asplenii]|uniref:TraI domain-containing protein n=1 Tax=Pseudomonas asplenii TaxID=53407 RepID=UPI0022342A6F|nr:TraI domain-containing protein [Pseudomonas asplenii]UZE26868.1 TraI domain-containing protein [Pseudomonas asplenii]